MAKNYVMEDNPRGGFFLNCLRFMFLALMFLTAQGINDSITIDGFVDGVAVSR